ncbi:hypothetical protein MBLNU459_g2076t1 [Dothideomycetes sp. NU459]
MMSTSASASASAATSAQPWTRHAQKTVPSQNSSHCFTPQELRVKRAVETEPSKLTKADNPAEYYRLTSSYASLQHANRERRPQENPAWRTNAEQLRIFARRCWPLGRRAHQLCRVGRFVQRRIDWYADDEEQLAAWEEKVAQLRGEDDEWDAAREDAVEREKTCRKTAPAVEPEKESERPATRLLEESAQVSEQDLAVCGDGRAMLEEAPQIASGRDGKQRRTAYRASRFIECVCAGNPEAECAVPCGKVREAGVERAEKKKHFQWSTMKRMHIFRRERTVKEAQMEYHVSLCTRQLSAYGYEQAKALTFKDYGEPKDILSLHGHSISPANKDLVTLKFLASPINPADINQLQGVYPSKPTFTTALGTSDPIAVGGNEGVAEVISAGSAVKGVSRGDWVVMKAPGFGTWRTHAQTTVDKLLPIKDRSGVTALQVGTVSVNPCTAYRMLKDFVALRDGDWFIQNGANSGVGRAAIQLARLWGLRSINIVRARDDAGTNEAMKQELRALGGDVVVTDAEAMDRGFRDQVKAWTQGGREPVRLALNCVGGKLVNSMAKVLAEGSHVVTYGAMSKQPVTVPASLQIFKDISFDGYWVSRWSEQHPDEKSKTVEHVLDLMRQGKFKDTPFQEVPWSYDTKKESLVEAVQGTLEGFRSGKGVFVFSNT